MYSGYQVNVFCNFLNNPIILLILLSLFLSCSWKSSLVSKIIPWCYDFADWVNIELLKFSDVLLVY